MPFNNAAKKLESNRRYRAAHRKELREYGRQYYLKNKEHIKQLTRNYQKTHRHVANHRKMVYSLLKQRDGNLCGLCGLPVETGKESIDHIIPIFEGGKDEAENLRLTHLFCNQHRERRRLDPEVTA